MTTGPDRLEEPAPTDTLIQLPMGPALQSPYPPHCRITFVAERLPGAPAELAAHIVEITRHNSPDACGDAVAAASKIQDALAAPAPAPPPAPARLGFAAGEPDDVMPVACGVFANTTPATCRAPRPVGVPHGARAVLGAGSFGPIAPDVSCAVLREAAAPVVGEVALAASGESRCIGLTDDGYAVHLGFFDRASVEEYCTSGDLGRMPVQVAGRDGIVCAPSPRAYGLVLPATGTAANTPGVLLVDGILNHPRGTLVTTPPADEARVRDLTTRIAEAAITRFLAS